MEPEQDAAESYPYDSGTSTATPESPTGHTQFLDLTNGEGGEPNVRKVMYADDYDDDDDDDDMMEDDEDDAEPRGGEYYRNSNANFDPSTPGRVVETGQEHTGRWTKEEHEAFLKALRMYGKEWKKVAAKVKTRTVVQTRTHAQKYFQKLAKARQNGEDGDVAMEGRNGLASVTSMSTTAAAPTAKRRRPTVGIKRKAIHSVVASAIRQGKKLAIEAATPDNPNPTPPLPAIAPALAHFILPPKNENGEATTSITTLQGTISGPALEDSL